MTCTTRVLMPAVFALVLFAGCSSSPPESLPPAQPITSDPDEPEWVTRPWSVSEDGVTGTTLYAVGYSPSNPDLSVQLEIARARARNELSRIIGSLVTAVTRDLRRTSQDFATTADASTDSLAVIQSEQITQELLQGSRQVDGWRDSDDGYWALVKLPLLDALASYRQSLLGQLQREGTPAETIKRVTASTDAVLDGLLAKDAEAVSAYIRGPINAAPRAEK